jgi:hypothetical protein
VTILSGLGRFFADKLRAGVAYAVRPHARVGSPARSGGHYRLARAAWVSIVEETQGIYRDDITFGLLANVRGHWADRLPAIEADLSAMEEELSKVEAAATPSVKDAAGKIAPLAMLDETLPAIDCSQMPPADFKRGQPVVIEFTFGPSSVAAQGIVVRLHYRRVNQVENYRVVEMASDIGKRRATIPADYTDSPYALQYFFELRDRWGRAWMYPGFTATLANQPYFIVQQSPARPV